jgi:hypothetical protein
MLAILLSVIAPTVSQALRNEHTDVAHHAHQAVHVAPTSFEIAKRM